MIRKSRIKKSGGGERAGLYLRLSDKDEGKKDTYSNSIENQKNYILDYLSDKPYLQVSDIYIDDGKTGSNYNRSGFQRMLDDIKARKINCVIVKDLSRLGRNFYETGALLETVFPSYEVRFIAVSDNFDSMDADFADLSFNMPITNFINEAYVVDASKKIRSARRFMAQNGRIPYGNVAFGYQKSTEDKYQLEINEEEAEVVKLIYSWFEEGRSKTSIARELNKKGILSPSQYKKQKGISTPYSENSIWTDAMVRAILKNPIYTGAAVFGRTKPDKPRGRNVPVPKENWILKEDIYPAIIAKEQFQRIQNRQKKNLLHQKPYQENIFLGLLYCGECKRRLKRYRIKKKKDIYYFECRSYGTGGSCCKKYINEEALKEMLKQCIKKYIQLGGKQQTVQRFNKLIPFWDAEKTWKIGTSFNVLYWEGEDNKQILNLKEKSKKNTVRGEVLEKDNQNIESVDLEKTLKREKEFLQILIKKIVVYEDSRILIIFYFKDLFYERIKQK